MGGKEHIVVEWLLKNALETQLPDHIAATMNTVPFSTTDYVNLADSLHANYRAKAASGTASMETCVAALAKVGADEDTIAAFKQARNRGRANDNPKGNSQGNKSRKCTPHYI